MKYLPSSSVAVVKSLKVREQENIKKEEEVQEEAKEEQEEQG